MTDLLWVLDGRTPVPEPSFLAHAAKMAALREKRGHIVATTPLPGGEWFVTTYFSGRNFNPPWDRPSMFVTVALQVRGSGRRQSPAAAVTWGEAAANHCDFVTQLAAGVAVVGVFETGGGVA